MNEVLEFSLEKTVRSRDDVLDFSNDIEQAVHNMWVDARTKDMATGEYEPVDVDIEITVRERD